MRSKILQFYASLVRCACAHKRSNERMTFDFRKVSSLLDACAWLNTTDTADKHLTTANHIPHSYARNSWAQPLKCTHMSCCRQMCNAAVNCNRWKYFRNKCFCVYARRSHLNMRHKNTCTTHADRGRVLVCVFTMRIDEKKKDDGGDLEACLQSYASRVCV